MGEYDSPRRNLPWDLLHPLVANRTTEDDGDCEPSSFVWPEDSDERVLVPFMLSLNEYNVLASAIDVGSDIAYGEDALRVSWLWLRNMRCTVDLCAMIADALLNCEDVQAALATLITTNPAIQNSIVNTVMDSDTFNNYLLETVAGLTTGQVTEKLIEGVCTNNVVMGKIKALVDKMHQTNLDFFEIVEVGTNDEEKLSLVLEAIPGLDELPFGDALDFLQDITEDFAENYDAQVTEALKEEWYCGLYCIAKSRPDCSITFADVFDYFQGLVASSLTIESAIVDVIEFIITGDFSGANRVANGMMALQAGLVRVGKDFVGLNMPSIALAARDAVTSELWEECDECPTEWEHCWGPDDLSGQWTINLGVDEPGIGISDALTQPGNSYRGISISKNTPLGTNITHAEYTFLYTPGTLNGGGDKTSYLAVTSGVLIDVETPTVPTSPQVWDGTATMSSITIQLLCGILIGIGDPGGSVLLTEICLRGPGAVDPFA